MTLLPIRKLPEVSSTGQVSDVLWLLEASGKLSGGFLVRICLLGCLLRYLVKSFVFYGTIFE